MLGVLEGPARTLCTQQSEAWANIITHGTAEYNLADGKINKDYTILEKANH